MKRFYLNYLIVAALALAAALTSCKKDDDGDKDPAADSKNILGARSVFVSGSDVYVAGTVLNTQGEHVARLWKNGTVQSLAVSGTKSAANSVFVSGGDVYVAGYEVNSQGKRAARLWKNGQAATFSSGSDGPPAFTVNPPQSGWNSVFVSGGNVYYAGYNINDKGQYSAQLYRNGEAATFGSGSDGPPTFVINPPQSAWNSVCVYGANVYYAGYEINSNGEYSARLYKNGQAATFDTGSDGPNFTINTRDTQSAWNSVFVYGSDVYYAGYEINDKGEYSARLFKNGQAATFSDGSGPGFVINTRTPNTHYSWNSVFVAAGGDVYSAGYERNDKGIYRGRLFKNGQAATFGAYITTDGKTHTSYNSVYVSAGDVYVAGYERDEKGKYSAKLWKNGVSQNLAQ